MKKLIVSVAVVVMLFGISGNSFATGSHGNSSGSNHRVSSNSPINSLIQFLERWTFSNNRSSNFFNLSNWQERKFNIAKKELISSLEDIKEYEKELDQCLKMRSDSFDDERTSEEIFNEVLNESMSFLEELFKNKDARTSKKVIEALKSFIKEKEEIVGSKQDQKFLDALTKMEDAIAKLKEDSGELLDVTTEASINKFNEIDRKVSDAVKKLKEEEPQELCFAEKKVKEEAKEKEQSTTSTPTSTLTSTPTLTPTPTTPKAEQPTKIGQPKVEQLGETNNEEPLLDELLKLLSQLNKPTKDPNEEELKKIKDMIDPLKKMVEEMAKKEPNKEEDKEPFKDLAKALEPKKDKGGEEGSGTPSGGGGTPSGGGGDKGGNDPKLPEPQKEDKEEPLAQQGGVPTILPGISNSSSPPISMRDDKKFSDDLDLGTPQVAAPTDDRTRGLLELVRLQQQLLMAAQQAAQQGGVNSVAAKFQGSTRRAPVRPYRYGNNRTQVRGMPQGARTIPSALQNSKR